MDPLVSPMLPWMAVYLAFPIDRMRCRLRYPLLAKVLLIWLSTGFPKARTGSILYGELKTPGQVPVLTK